MKKIILLGLLLTILPLSACQGNTNPSTSGDSTTPITVDWNSNDQYPNHGELKNGNKYDFYLLNDTHGSAEYLPEQGEPGINRISTYLNNKRAENEEGTILISAGDMFQGSLDSNISQGSLMIDWMKYAKFDAMTIGNHEFDWGTEVLKSNIAKLSSKDNGQWGVPVLANNIVETSTGNKEFGEPYVTFMKNGAKIAIIGSIASSCKSSIDSTIINKYDFQSPTKIVSEQAKGLRAAGADIIAYATHGNAASVSKSLASDVDLVFCGHSHYEEDQTFYSAGNAVPVIQAACNGKIVGHVQFEYKNGNFENISQGNSSYLTDMGLSEDTGSKTIYDGYLSKSYSDGPVSGTLNEMKTQKVGTLESTSGLETISKSYITTLFTNAQFVDYKDVDNIVGSYYNDARTGWVVGDLTYEDIYKAFPFDNTTMIVKATGSQLNSSWSSVPCTKNISYDENTEYKVITCSYVINNLNVKYLNIEKTYEGLYQRHIMYTYLKRVGTVICN